MTVSQTLYTLTRLSRLLTAVNKGQTGRYAKRVGKSWITSKLTGSWRMK